MKLRNKKTGKIIEWENNITYKVGKTYYSLAELEQDWEDYDDNLGYYIGPSGINGITGILSEKTIDWLKEIGNFFETREEAEKAVEKLKAFKRLKDKGMIKYSFHREKGGIDLDFYILTILAPREKDSLDLLFGGEE